LDWLDLVIIYLKIILMKKLFILFCLTSFSLFAQKEYKTKNITVEGNTHKIEMNWILSDSTITAVKSKNNPTEYVVEIKKENETTYIGYQKNNDKKSRYTIVLKEDDIIVSLDVLDEFTNKTTSVLYF
jgi:hypothetical protein